MPMRPEIAKAQADTLKEWADQWNRDALVSPDQEGYGEVAFLLRRTATAIAKAIGDEDADGEQSAESVHEVSGIESGDGPQIGYPAGDSAEIREG